MYAFLIMKRRFPIRTETIVPAMLDKSASVDKSAQVDKRGPAREYENVPQDSAWDARQDCVGRQDGVGRQALGQLMVLQQEALGQLMVLQQEALAQLMVLHCACALPSSFGHVTCALYIFTTVKHRIFFQMKRGPRFWAWFFGGFPANGLFRLSF